MSYVKGLSKLITYKLYNLKKLEQQSLSGSSNLLTQHINAREFWVQTQVTYPSYGSKHTNLSSYSDSINNS